MRASNPGELLLWLIGRRQRCRVVGGSMLPLLRSGDEVLVDLHAYRRRPPARGDIVVASHPQEPGVQIIKRIAAVEADGGCLLQGDNPDPTQTSACRVPPRLIRGRVTSRFGSDG